jgi:hypothetical protein
MWDKIVTMKPGLIHREHASYKVHRIQVRTQILLPIVSAILMFITAIVLICVVTIRNPGDQARWAAISTIWLLIPVLFLGLILLIVLGSMIYLFSRISAFILPYSRQAQRFAYRMNGGVNRFAGMMRKPVLFAHGIGALLKSAAQKARERK